VADDPVPPVPARTVYRTGLAGAGLCLLASAVGLAVRVSETDGPGFVSTIRLLLVAVGAVTAGAAVSLRPKLPFAWLIAGTASLLAVVGIPPHWDSAVLVAEVLTGVAATGAVLAYLPLGTRLTVASFMIVFHFTGILCAVTWPTPTPWMTEQIGTRVHLKYLMFMYLRNAYHFYSPEPGPASLIYALVTYDAVDPATGQPEAEWVQLPRRDLHMKDPLGLTYFRRLSVTEQISMTVPDYVTPSGFERLDIRQRREAVALGNLKDYPRIPLAPPEIEQPIHQYRMPYPSVTRYILPAYAAHLLHTQKSPLSGAAAKTVKIYRLEHRILDVRQFKEGVSPFHPTTQRPYFLGEFKLDPATDTAELTDPQDPMLYWLVPVLPKASPGKAETVDDEIDDYLSRHARFKVEWRRP
jgi:hypothetical protein